MGRARARLTRDYRAESSLGSFVADVMRKATGAQVAITNAGGLRADLPEGPVRKGHVLDALPFVNTAVVCEMKAAQIREVLEQGLTLERGMAQVSGLRVTYDLSRPRGQRLVSLAMGGQPPDERATYRVATNSFLAQGGDLYETFLRVPQQDSRLLLSELVMEHFRKEREVAPPELGRLVPVSKDRSPQ